MRLETRQLEALCAAIAHRTTALLTAALASRYKGFESRRTQIGGMLELARRLADPRLVHFLEAHKDALSRLIEAP